ncbi:flagellar basal body rod protein FlgB [Paenibacillus thalictri]|uniref:Flagellar basal body rod protein FlgB n=1 Tax=Paenibacillus thalictri TaxID=2527873 RepID=A0A4Q9DQR6_9BACL|nr:flagellar basal body rod protein FlgB [Paenibacillus thalictri]TBL77722.1 flagellar basal body rod protein FlgB [Paenibacillus thalictri]
MFLLNKPSFQLMERSLDASTLRQKVISNNVANVDTPYYKRSEVRFEELLEQQMNGSSLEGRRTDPRHFYIGRPAQPVQPEVVSDGNTSINNNLNNVDVDYEMSLMAKNQLRYNVVVQELNSELKRVRTAIEGRR